MSDKIANAARSIKETVNQQPAAIAMTAGTAVKLADAFAERIYFRAETNDPQDVFVRLFPQATTPSLQVGITIRKGQPYIMPAVAIYSGEISAIPAVDSPDVFITEY